VSSPAYRVNPEVAPRPRRILQVVPTYYPAFRYGGPIRSVHGLASALARRGHHVEVFTTHMDGPGNLDVPVDRPVDLDGVRVHYFPVPALRRLAWSPAMQRGLSARMHEFDVVHLHSVFLWPTQAAASAARRAGIPYLLAPRGILVPELIAARNRWIKKAWIELFERRVLANAAGLHVTSDVEVADVTRLALPFRRHYLIGNGVDVPTHFSPLESGPFARIPRPYALFLSRITWKKGLDRLIRAWKHVKHLPLVIGGNDDEGLTPKLTELARNEGVLPRLHFIGEVRDADKWALYANARMFLLPSYSENFGNVVAEAMSMSCPVVVTPEVGLAQLVASSGSGIVTSGDPRDLSAVINRLNADESQRREFGRRGAATVEKLLSWNALAPQMEAAYEDAIARQVP
jgi:glycosyltransferase involved in cell wall biosynthesis